VTRVQGPIRLSLPWKTLLGILSLWPTIWAAGSLYLFFRRPLVSVENGQISVDQELMWNAGLVSFGTWMLTILLIGVYLYWLFKGVYLSDTARIVWAILLVLAAPPSLVAFWIVFVLKEGALFAPRPPVAFPPSTRPS